GVARRDARLASSAPWRAAALQRPPRVLRFRRELLLANRERRAARRDGLALTPFGAPHRGDRRQRSRGPGGTVRAVALAEARGAIHELLRLGELALRDAHERELGERPREEHVVRSSPRREEHQAAREERLRLLGTAPLAQRGTDEVRD